MTRKRLLLIAGLAGSLLGVLPETPIGWAQTAPAAPAGVTWFTNYEAATEAARQANKPLLVVFGAVWCPACHDLDASLKSPEVQKELGTVDRVYVDFDSHQELARKLGVGLIPALRVVKPTGRTVGVYDGSMPAPELASWLRDAVKSAAEARFDPALDTDELSAEAIAKLIALLGNADATLREAAIRRLLPQCKAAAPAVVQVFTQGQLAQRFSALDLLENWQAPVKQLDPWRSETLTPQRLDELQKWAANPPAADAAQTAPALDEKQRAEASALLQRYLHSPDDEAPALRERLARYGTALLPDIYAALKEATTDALHERLTLLRYRVAASDTLALQWPRGLEHLASMQVKVRHAELDELSNRVSAKDTGLLLELFSDPDALVRETALRLLQKVGGPSATDALTGLLQDPDPNVRAAVLKSVAEAPTAQIVAKIATFVTREKDTDLIVHAARVLRNAASPAAVKTLYTLLENPSWRVRAEATEALTEKAGARSNATPDQQAEFFVRMLDLLEDPDGFVASRALSALEGAQGLPSVEKIAKTADKHPDLAAMAIHAMTRNVKSDPKSITYIRAYLTHQDPAVRAAAVTSLADVLGERAAEDLHRALSDTEERVRLAAAGALMEQMSILLPDSDRFMSNAPAVPYDTALANLHAGKTRPKWLADFRPDLEKLLNSASPAEGLHAALPLIALGFDDPALLRLKLLVARDHTLVDTAAEALTWLTWEDRLALFNVLKTYASGASLARLAAGLAVSSDPRAAESLWAMLGDARATWATAEGLETSLRRAVLGDSFYGELAIAQRREVTQSVAKYIASGNDIQKSLALVILSSADPVAADAAAAKFAGDAASSTALRHDALQIRLNLLPVAEAEQIAVTHLSDADIAQRDLALQVLTGDEAALRYLHGGIYLESSSRRSSSPSGVPIVPRAPKGLTAEAVRPLLENKDPHVAADAGYLLALLKDRSGLDKLLDYYHKNSSDHDRLCRLVYRAITSLDEDTYTPTLTEIYKTLAKSGSYELREFYWTIRSMTGEKCTALRQHIRDEVGMDALR